LPIVFTPGGNGETVGPGIAIAWGSDLIGPIPDDYFWQIIVSQGGGEGQPWLIEVKTAGGSHVGVWVPFIRELGEHFSVFSTNAVVPGADTTITVELRSPTAVVDSGTIVRTYDGTTGLPLVIEANNALTDTGFTISDRAQLELAVANTTVQLPIDAVGGLVNAGLARLLQGVPGYVLRRHGSVHLTGDGSLPRGSGVFASYSMGIEWLFDDPPPGFGYAAGNVREYERRMVQWEPVFETPLHETYWSDLVDAHENGQRLVWGAYTPLALNYSIAPGLGLTVWFLVFNALP
jgi:hypothetical protein